MGKLGSIIAGLIPKYQIVVDLFEGGIVGAAFSHPSWVIYPLYFEVVT